MSSVLHKLYGLPLLFAQVVPEFDPDSLPQAAEAGTGSTLNLPVILAIAAGIVALLVLLWAIKRRHAR